MKEVWHKFGGKSNKKTFIYLQFLVTFGVSNFGFFEYNGATILS